MKKIISIALAAVMALGSIGALAAEENSAAMEKSLAAVKTKVEIPAELTEFSSHMYAYNSDDRENKFEFIWSEKDKYNNLQVTADEEGRIKSYDRYNWSEKEEESTLLAKNNKSTVVKFAEEQLKKLMPEAFTDKNNLKLSKYSYNNRYYDSDYQISFDRVWDDTEINGEFVSLRIDEDENGKLSLNSMYADYNYNAEFEEKAEEAENLEEEHKKLSPSELEYDIDYSGEKLSVRLIYTNENKFMSVYTLDEVKPYNKYIMYRNQLAGGSMTMDAAASLKEYFSEEEQKELDNIKGLKSKDEILSAAKKIEIFAIDKDAEVSDYNIYKTDRDKEEYRIYITTSDDKRISANAKTGEILSFYSYSKYDYLDVEKAEEAENSENKVTAENVQAKAEKFLKSNSSVFGEYRLYDTFEECGCVSLNYVRYVNGIPFKNDGITIDYDLKEDKLIRYDSYYSDYEFPKPENIISADEAYNKLLEISPIEKAYVRTEDNIYKLCCFLPYCGDIKAENGERVYTYENSNYAHDEYTDISGHWCEEKARVLEQSGVAFNGNLLKPDEPINQADLIRICAELKFGMGGRYMAMDNKELYESTGSFMRPFYEDNSKSSVSREHACVYLARTVGLDKYIGNHTLFKTPFADGNNISDDSLGAVALMVSSGVIGNTGNFRPKDYITYAEAVSMMYNIVVLGLN